MPTAAELKVGVATVNAMLVELVQQQVAAKEQEERPGGERGKRSQGR